LIAALHRGGLPRGIAVCYASGMDAALSHLIAAVEAEHEYAQMPFFVRPLVKRGFEKRTGRGFAAWRALLADARRGQRTRELADALRALAEHYQGAPARARRGMGATTAQLAIVEQRSRVRSDAARALREALVERAVPDPPVG
jgi:phosphatidylserine/phosphatidylglycerophosphate/cardiolipin synthase-like enzyme